MTVALWCVLVAAVLPIVCTMIAKWGFKGFDNHNPRAWLAGLTGWRARAHAAQGNSWEAFAVFSAGVFAAHLAQAPQSRIDIIAVAFVLARVVFIALYVANLASLRSLVWGVGFFLSVALFVIGA